MTDLRNAPEILKGYARALGISAENQETLPGKIAETISPVMDLWSLPEWHLLRGSLLAMGNANVGAGGAGKRSIIQLWNPATSDRLVVMESVALYGGPVYGGTVHVDSTMLGTQSSTYGLQDLRKKRSWTSSYDTELLSHLRTSADASLGTAWARMVCYVQGANYPCRIIVPPGYGVTMQPGADNNALDANVVWREVRMLPGEFTAQLR